MRGAFSWTDVFFTRDLSFFYWPHHLWFRSKLLEGTLPLWDPYVAFGQSALADPIRQTLFPPALLLRLLPPVVGFNLFVALPVWVSALSTYVFLRHHASRPASSLGAVVFALSGPVLSTANSPNMAWSIALAPATIAAVAGLAAAPCARRASALALLFALQALAGESVTFLATSVLAALYGAVAVNGADRGHARGRVVLVVGAAWTVGVMLAAPQLLPVFRAATLSGRGTQVLPDVLSLHPLALVETVARPVFGDWFEPWGVNDPWVQGLYGLYVSTYVGATALALAVAGALSPDRLRGRLFWCVVGAGSLLLALGRFTPVHRAFLAALPLARTFRYPAKYAIFTMLAVAVLAATGWDALGESGERRRRRAAAAAACVALAVAVGAALAVAALALWPASAGAALSRLGRAAGLSDPVAGATYLAGSLRAALPRTVALASLGAACLWAARRRPAARWALLALVAADLLAANGGLNPTLDAGLLGEPPWAVATRAHPGDRIYIGGRLSWLFDLSDPDDPGAGATPPPSATRAVVSSVYAAMFATFPSPWALREAASANLSFLWPLEYTVMMRNLVNSGREGRTRLLRRAGVRYFLIPRPPAPDARALLRLPRFNDTALFEIPQPAPRASVVTRYSVIPDTKSQTDRLFDAGFDPAQEVVLEAGPAAAAGVAGPPRDPRAWMERDGLHEVALRVQAPEGGGFLVLLDSYDRDFEVEVDGKPAASLRANGLFRAVRVASGEHEARWTYRPRAMRAGMGVAAAALLALLAGNFFLEARARQK